MKANISLKNRIIIAFTIQTLIIAITAFFMLKVYVGYIEETLLYEHLSKDLDAYVVDLANNKIPLLSEDVQIFGKKRSDIPEFTKGLDIGVHEIILDTGISYHVLIKIINGTKFTLIKDQTAFEIIEEEISQYTLIILTIFTFISFLFSRSLANKIIRPIIDLSDKVSTLNVDNFNTIKLDYPDDEIGALVKVVYEHVNTINLYLQREKWFTGDISHELRTPMMIISSSMDILKLNAITPEQQNELYYRIDDAISNVNELINTFLLLARGEINTNNNSHNNFCNIHTLSNVIINNLSPYASNKNIEFKVIEESVMDMPVNSGMFSIVLTNLVKNAILNTEKGTISIVIHDNGITVKDTGKGLTARIKQFINGDELTVSKKSGSQGLGLSIVKRVCEKEQWDITAYDSDVVGACFTIKF
ncbi:hypothetical protein MNBD_GAMMA07-204 [hydrothermal vent metagenome]|uniref:histidine kinase n=1 Tax=hydrothermal vent metagenome TaxID=652676 RepID=A0A3B0WJ27_9ZZZZ